MTAGTKTKMLITYRGCFRTKKKIHGLKPKTRELTGTIYIFNSKLYWFGLNFLLVLFFSLSSLFNMGDDPPFYVGSSRWLLLLLWFLFSLTDVPSMVILHTFDYSLYYDCCFFLWLLFFLLVPTLLWLISMVIVFSLVVHHCWF